MNPDPARELREAHRLRRWIERKLPPEALGRPLELFAELPSTNDYLKGLALEGAPEGAAVVALSQTRGRGQPGRSWISPPNKGLYLSVLLRPPPERAEGPWLAAASALAVADALTSAGVPAISIKPPNDVLAHGRKIAGVLVEPRIGRRGMEFAVAGLGVNLTHGPDDFAALPPERPATSCRMEAVELDLPGALLRVLVALTERYRQLAPPRRAELSAAWSAFGGTATP